MNHLRTVISFYFLLVSLSVFAQNTDIDLLREININRWRDLDGLFRFITNAAGIVSYAMPVLIFVLSYFQKEVSFRRKSYFMVSSLLLSALVTNILKYTIDRPRPFSVYPDIEKLTGGGSPSFPSGHTSDAFVLATSLSLAFPRWYVILPSYLWAAAVGYSRMSLGVHYPGDVLAGAFIGAGAAVACFLFFRQFKRPK